MFFILFALTASRNIGLFVKINTVGVFFIVIIILFIVGKGFSALENTDFIYVYNQFNIPKVRETENTGYIVLFNTTFFSIVGMLGTSFFLHIIALPICRNARTPENNNRDIFIGFLLAYITNVLCGTLGYIGFSGAQFFSTSTY